MDWEHLGPNAYQSFQILFKSISKSIQTPLTSNGAAIDALWIICLAARNDDVATQAMRYLLFAYSSISVMKQQGTAQNAWSQKITTNETNTISFAKRIFRCLQQIQEGLKAGVSSSERSAERCIRILNAAVDHSVGVGKKDDREEAKPRSCRNILRRPSWPIGRLFRYSIECVGSSPCERYGK